MPLTGKEETAMPRFIKRGSKKAGAAPGTLIHIGEKMTEKARIHLIDFAEAHVDERELGGIAEAVPLKDLPTVTWINIDGLHDIDLMQTFGEKFGIHPLIQEDILNTGHRPKLEEFDDYLFVVLKMLLFNSKDGEIQSEQVSLIIGPNFLVSFQETPGDIFDPIRERIRKGKGRIRKSGCAYLAYALIDAIVDNYFTVLEGIGEKIETLEEELISELTTETVETIHALKREMIYLRKQVWPMREVVGALSKGGSSLLDESTRIFFADVYDHNIQIIDTIESFRDILSGMLDLYLSTISNRMNEVMKVLTIIATIFIPLTFVAGIYGMNFKYMPELEWRWGYFGVWVVMVAIAGFLVSVFRKKKWL
jgi:magnesium transporter